jgi:hypothetical protein
LVNAICDAGNEKNREIAILTSSIKVRKFNLNFRAFGLNQIQSICFEIKPSISPNIIISE